MNFDKKIVNIVYNFFGQIMSHLTIETLSTGTIPQIKEWCKNNGLSYPYKLKKAEAIEYLKTEYNKKIGFNNDTAVSTIPQNVNTPINIPTSSSSLTVNTLESGTVAQIKEWAKENKYDCPSKLNKKYLIEYLKGLHTEKQLGIIYTNINSDMKLNELIPKYADNSIDWLSHLHKYGWAVAPIDNWNPNFTKMFFDWFESCNPAFKGLLPETWKSKNMPTQLHGILKHYFGHTELQWQIRELCVPIFAKIWGINPLELLCSFDGGCFLPAKEKRNKNKSWIHVDQSRYHDRGFCSVQGVVNFVDNGPEDGGLVLVENSRDVFNAYMEKYPSQGIMWTYANMENEMLSNKKLIKICAPAGSILLFDSRMFHCNTQPTGSVIKPDGTPRFRMATYVSMQPRVHATSKELEKRKELYEKGRLTGHWCYGHYFDANPENPYTHGGVNNRPEVIEIAKLNPLRKRLIGYSE